MSEPFLALFKHQHDHHSEYAMVYSDEIEDKIDQIMLELKHCYPNLINYRWHALKLLEGDTPMQSCWSPAKKILNPVIAKKSVRELRPVIMMRLQHHYRPCPKVEPQGAVFCLCQCNEMRGTGRCGRGKRSCLNIFSKLIRRGPDFSRQFLFVHYSILLIIAESYTSSL